MSERIKVFHVEDYLIMREGVRHLLGNDEAIEFVGEAQNGDQLIRKLQTTKVDVVILDIYLDAMEDLTTMNGFQICPAIRKHNPRIKVLAHSIYDDADRVAAIFNAGASAFVSKKSGFDELLYAIKAIHNGEKFICRETSSRLKNVSRFLSGMEKTLREKEALLSKREREVLSLLAQGKSSRQIASLLFVTERTIETHRQNMLEKMHAKNTVELVASALTLGLIKK